MSRTKEGADVLAKSTYWDERYKCASGNETTHEWFRSFEDLGPFLEARLFNPFPPHDGPTILHLGSGDSDLPQRLCDHGYTKQVCIDFSAVLVERMSMFKLEGMTWLLGDVRHMSAVADCSFDVTFDKGTLDAMLHGSPWDPPEDVRSNTGNYMREVSRVLKDHGTFLYVTFQQPHFVEPLLNQDNLWVIEHEELQTVAGAFPYNAFVMTKRCSTRDV